jgi:hypothetical protein
MDGSESYAWLSSLPLEAHLKTTFSQSATESIQELVGPPPCNRICTELQRDIRVKVILVARPLLNACCDKAAQVQTWCIQVQNVRSSRTLFRTENICCYS